MLWAARSVAQPACTPDASLPIPVYPCELNKLEGIFTPLAGSAERAGPINEPALRRFISWQIDRGVHGLYPNSSTGEFTRFSVEERRRIVHVVTDEAGGRVPMLAGTAEANVKETISACEAYAHMGARLPSWRGSIQS